MAPYVSLMPATGAVIFYAAIFISDLTGLEIFNRNTILLESNILFTAIQRYRVNSYGTRITIEKKVYQNHYHFLKKYKNGVNIIAFPRGNFKPFDY